MKFYKLAPEKRREMLQKQGIKLDQVDSQVLHDLDLLSENVIGQLRLPVGLAQNLLVNGQNYQVPMVTEEASVVAAANNGAGIVAKAGGFTASSQRDGIWGQIVMQVAENFEVSNLQEVLPTLIKKTNTDFASLVSHGGGVRKIELKQINDLLYIKVLVDPAEAMGANKVNSILEFMADKLEDFAGIKQKLFAILSNYPSQITTVKAAIPVDLIGGTEIARKIALLSQIGQDDPMRAVTNNKGIMNGVDSVLLATGNDTRAVEAACGVFASKKDTYISLSKWQLENENLIGKLSIPLPIGTVGGSINNRKDVKQNYRILGEKITAEQLANIIAAIGLANNLAALLAISTRGIQAGHMKLQARNIVAVLDATAAEKKVVFQKIINSKKYSQSAAKEFLKEIREENNASRN
ncbi:hydroxymethylglutaryl-CoA reductase, degradative [Lactobacillus sp. wkB10]|uniref:hydroxymethylglutaryl-CoA reductase, degradative n=1 Tax=Lactobacillus sp. wkB10 TaxID=1545701 RepID=UPI000513D80B|nr:hydroxymethylglutaryl-CoA reductase, degradative [Lactobacillus sp. wkB10]KGG55038.1 Hydroxymethylglutaryl-CoA reductase [Lactobacillus sp. wkB10]